MNTKQGSVRLQSELDTRSQSVRWVNVNTDQTPLKLDSACRQLLKEANFLAAFKARTIESTEPQRYCEFDWLQQPIIGYFDSKNTFRVFAGLFSYQQAISHKLITIPVFSYDKAPPASIRRRAVLGELTRILLDQQPKRGAEHLRDILYEWFKKKEVKTKKSKNEADENGTDHTSLANTNQTDMLTKDGNTADNQDSDGNALNKNTPDANTSDQSTSVTNEANSKPVPAKTADIFTSKEWQSLYPGIKNKAQFCAWQGISSKTFRDKNDD
jgi:hypothetical protein